MNVNEYTDKTLEEVKLYETVQLNDVSIDMEKIIKYRNYFEKNESVEIPNEIDWRLKGAVTSVKKSISLW